MGLYIKDDKSPAINLPPSQAIGSDGNSNLISFYSAGELVLGHAYTNGYEVDSARACVCIFNTDAGQEYVRLYGGRKGGTIELGNGPSYGSYAYPVTILGSTHIHGDTIDISSHTSNGVYISHAEEYVSIDSARGTSIRIWSSFDINGGEGLRIYSISFTKADWQKLKNYCEEH